MYSTDTVDILKSFFEWQYELITYQHGTSVFRMDALLNFIKDDNERFDERLIFHDLINLDYFDIMEDAYYDDVAPYIINTHVFSTTDASHCLVQHCSEITGFKRRSLKLMHTDPTSELYWLVNMTEIARDYEKSTPWVFLTTADDSTGKLKLGAIMKPWDYMYASFLELVNDTIQSLIVKRCSILSKEILKYVTNAEVTARIEQIPTEASDRVTLEAIIKGLKFEDFKKGSDVTVLIESMQKEVLVYEDSTKEKEDQRTIRAYHHIVRANIELFYGEYMENILENLKLIDSPFFKESLEVFRGWLEKDFTKKLRDDKWIPLSNHLNTLVFQATTEKPWGKAIIEKVKEVINENTFRDLFEYYKNEMLLKYLSPPPPIHCTHPEVIALKVLYERILKYLSKLFEDYIKSRVSM